MKYCVYCDKMVLPQKQWSPAAFWLLMILAGAGLWLYLPYYLLFKRKQCPSCGGKKFLQARPQPRLPK